MEHEARSANGARLDTWSEIAAYLGRSERTVRRWEAKEGLPVHRLQHEKRGSVYAYTGELDRWRESRTGGPPAVRHPDTGSSTRLWRGAAAAAALAAVVTLLAFSIGGSAPDPPDATAWQAHTSSAEAWAAYVQAIRYCDSYSTTSLHTAVEYFERAIALDPEFADAHGALAITWISLASFGEMNGTEAIGRARLWAHRTLALDPRSAAASIALGLADWFDLDPAGAEAWYERALEVNPESAVAWQVRAELRLDQGRVEEALADLDRAFELDPGRMYLAQVRGTLHYFEGELETGIRILRDAVAREPNFGLTRFYLARALLDRGLHEAAVAQMRHARMLLEPNPFSDSGLAYVLARSGHEAEARAMLDGMLSKREAGNYPAIAIATVQMGLGDIEGAWASLETAIGERLMFWYTPLSEPLFAELRADPRFSGFARRIGLADTATAMGPGAIPR